MLNHEWETYNRNYLRLCLDRLYQDIQQQAESKSVPEETERFSEPIPALERVCREFGLSEFERKLLLFCAGVQLDRQFGQLCVQQRNDETKPWASFDLALTLFNDGEWLAFSSQSTLRYWGLLDLEDSGNTGTSPLRISETILHYLTGNPITDPSLEQLFLPLISDAILVPSHQALMEKLSNLVLQTVQHGHYPFVLLDGPDNDSKLRIARQAFQARGMRLFRLEGQLLPRDTQALHHLYKRLHREAILHGCAFLFEYSADDYGQDAWKSLNYLLQRLPVPCVVSGNISASNFQREAVKISVNRPTYAEQGELWRQGLDSRLQELDGRLTNILDQFDFTERQINNVLDLWQIEANSPSPGDAHSCLWSLCREQARHKLIGLARIIEPGDIAWERLVLPDNEARTIRKIVEQIHQRHRVYQEWGFAGNGSYGLGISALFAGVSGTGKTLAARVIGSELGLDIYHIDLSAIISKYIGETEKNLERIFSAAENSGAILLFDEADALFGKRSQVNDSKDRYANMEVSYLLQRMESYSGLSILTTNMKSSMDDAFIRRLRFIVQFPFPKDSEREVIWRSVFPAATPISGIDFGKLSRLEIPGGLIRSIAINAAFHAANDDTDISMRHIKQAALDEYAKSEKTLLQEIISDW